MKNHISISKIAPIAAVLFLSISCSSYQSLLNSDNVEKKYEAAKEYYNDKEYQKALPLFEDILTYYRGTTKGEKVMFYYAYCQYGVNKLEMASFRFKNFYDTYPNSEFAEESLYMYAYCLYLKSPPIELDQSTSRKAIDAFQLFTNRYPNSYRIEKCNKFIDQLRNKLERKAFERARLWFQIQDYKAALRSFRNFINEYPVSGKKEKAKFYSLKSQYKIAEKSVTAKMEERLKKTIRKYREFTKTYPDSEFYSEAIEIGEKAKSNLEQFKNDRQNG